MTTGEEVTIINEPRAVAAKGSHAMLRAPGIGTSANRRRVRCV